MMWIRYLPALCLLLFLTQASAKEPSLGPVIEDYGPTFPIDERDVRLREDFAYRVVFDVAGGSGGSTSINRELVSVARYLNMHARNGVPIENMNIAVVLHGKALTSALSNEAHESRYDIQNPNHDLLLKLHESGVKLYACGQSMAFGRISKNELAGPVEVALSAMTMLTVLQSDGFALLP